MNHHQTPRHTLEAPRTLDEKVRSLLEINGMNILGSSLFRNCGSTIRGYDCCPSHRVETMDQFILDYRRLKGILSPFRKRKGHRVMELEPLEVGHPNFDRAGSTLELGFPIMQVSCNQAPWTMVRFFPCAGAYREMRHQYHFQLEATAGQGSYPKRRTNQLESFRRSMGEYHHDRLCLLEKYSHILCPFKRNESAP